MGASLSFLEDFLMMLPLLMNEKEPRTRKLVGGGGGEQNTCDL